MSGQAIKPGTLCYVTGVDEAPWMNGRVVTAVRYVGVFTWRIGETGWSSWFSFERYGRVRNAWLCTSPICPGDPLHIAERCLRPITDPDEPPVVDDEIEGLDDELRRVIAHARPV